MDPQARSRRPSGIVQATPKRVSWTSLLATSTQGLGPVDSLRTVVHTEPGADLGDGARRLVVHWYDEAEISGGVPRASARPLGWAQRIVTPEELRDGVRVNVLCGETGGCAVAVAWLADADGSSDLGAMCERPVPTGLYGIGPALEAGQAKVTLRRCAA